MRHLGAILLMLLLGLAQAAPAETRWQALDGPGIRAALEGRKLAYENAWQDFRVSGRTLYNAGRDSWGYWRVEDDRYCSMWPPSDLWACYRLERKGARIRFVGDTGDIIEAIYAD